MTTAQDKIAQYLQEAHAMERSLARTLQAHRAVTPAGPYRTALDRHLRETRGHADRIRRRLRALGREPGLAERGYGIAQQLAGQLVALGKAPLDLLRGASPEEKLLKNAKDECASEQLEIATYDALESLAERAGDEETAKLASDVRAEERRMLDTLHRQLPALTAAVTGAEVGVEPEGSGDGGAGGISPLPRYDELTVEDVTARLEDLTIAQLRDVAGYERAHKDRRGVIDAVEREEHEREERDHREHAAH